MRAGDVVRVRRSSTWHEVIGDADGEVKSVVEHTRLAWVRFEVLSLTAEGWGWEEFMIVAERDEASLR